MALYNFLCKTKGIVTFVFYSIILLIFTSCPGKNIFVYDLDSLKKSGASSVISKKIKSVNLDMKGCTSLAIDAQNNLIVGGLDKIVILDSAFKQTASFPVLGTVTAAACLPDSLLCAALDRHIEVFDYTGNQKSTWASLGNDSVITSISANNQYVVAADAGGRKVYVYTLQGQLITIIDGKSSSLPSPGFIIPGSYFDAVITPDNTIWTANAGLHRMENYSITGILLKYWGKPGSALSEFCGCCNPIHFCLTTDGWFITAEKGISRIKLYNNEGRFMNLINEPAGWESIEPIKDMVLSKTGEVIVLDSQSSIVIIFSKPEI